MDLQDLIKENIGAIIVSVITIIYSYARLEVKVGALIKDVDAIAEIIGTKRALSRKQKNQKEE